MHVLYSLFGLIELMNAVYTQLVIESQIRLALIDFLKGLVELDPSKRWSPVQVIIECLIFYINPSLKLYLSRDNAKFKL